MAAKQTDQTNELTTRIALVWLTSLLGLHATAAATVDATTTTLTNLLTTDLKEEGIWFVAQ